ncbi:MAG: hypothetical protein AB7F75_12375, partial [Planctomycetota bacterium]
MFRQRGFVLIIVVAVLGVLGFLAVELAMVSQTSRQLSTRQLDFIRARLAARSGLEKVLVGLRLNGWRGTWTGLPFERQLVCAGEDRNRDGILDPSEDKDADSRLDTLMSLEEDLTPSMAMADAPGGNQSLVLETGGTSHGVTWCEDRADPTLAAVAQIHTPMMNLNDGILSGWGAEGSRLALNHNHNYSAVSKDHPFNVPIRRFLNAWGNYHKYRAMVRDTKTYNFDGSTPNGKIDGADNLMNSVVESDNPASRFDFFNPSEDEPEALHRQDANGLEVFKERPLGDLLIEARPMMGYTSLQEPLAILETYLRSWVDIQGLLATTGSWHYADGSSIPALTDNKIGEILAEFASLAMLESAASHNLDRGFVFHMGTIPPRPAYEAYDRADGTGISDPLSSYDPYRSLTLGEFSRHKVHTRFRSNYRVYTTAVSHVDVNLAPESVLTALFYAPGQVSLDAYNPKLSRLEREEDFSALTPYMSENNWSHAVVYGNSPRAKRYAPGQPILSMTESLRLAKDVAARRASTPFGGLSDLTRLIRAWRKGYDAREPSLYVSPAHQFNPDNSPGVQYYYDVYHGHRRVQMLSYLINPHTNNPDVVWDQALPQPVDNLKNRIATTLTTDVLPAGWHDRRFLFAKNLHEQYRMGLQAKTQSSQFQIKVLGLVRQGPREPRSSIRLSTSATPFIHLSAATQKEWNAIARDPITGTSTLGTSFVSYPEMPGVAPCEWDGHIALMPQSNICRNGERLKLRVNLSGYKVKPTNPFDGSGNPVDAWPKGERLLAGPSDMPARGKFLNSLFPIPSGPITSLFHNSAFDVYSSSDLLPGGGIRMSPLVNSDRLSALPGGDRPNRMESLLVLRNALISQSDDNALP